MKKFLLPAAAAFLASAGFTTAWAQEEDASLHETAAIEVSADASVTAAAETPMYVGKAVFDLNGQQIGTIEEVVVTEEGVEQAVLSVGSFLGIGSKKIAVDTTTLSENADGSGFTTTMSAEEIEAAEAYAPPAEE